jgi:hypothetical protein
MDNRPLYSLDYLRPRSWPHRRPGGLGLRSLFRHARAEVKRESAMNPTLILCIASIVVEAALTVLGRSARKLMNKRK